MTTYFLGKICLARNLEPAIPEECLVTKLAYHFNQGISQGRLNSQIKTIQGMCALLESHEQERYYQRNRQGPGQTNDRGGPGNVNPTNNNDRNNYGRTFNNPPRFQNQQGPRQNGGGNHTDHVDRGNFNNPRPSGYQREGHYPRGNNYYRPYNNQSPNNQQRHGNGNHNNNQFRRVNYAHASRGGNRRNYYQGRRSFPNHHSNSNHSDREDREPGYSCLLYTSRCV